MSALIASDSRFDSALFFSVDDIAPSLGVRTPSSVCNDGRRPELLPQQAKYLVGRPGLPTVRPTIGDRSSRAPAAAVAPQPGSGPVATGRFGWFDHWLQEAG